MTHNVTSKAPLAASNDNPLQQAEYFKYLGSSMESWERVIKDWKDLARRVLKNLKNIQTSNLLRMLQAKIFITATETIPLHGCEAWTTTAVLSKCLDWGYIRMVCVAFNINWQQQVTNAGQYDDLLISLG